jgi:DNA recombination protein RmuC
MEVTIVGIGIIAVVIIVALVIMRKLDGLKEKEDDQTILLLQKQISDLTNQLNDRLTEQNRIVSDQMKESNRTMQNQFSISSRNLRDINETSSKIVKEVTEKLTKLDETNKQIVSFADQLQSLENILKNPKQRGVLGEYFLETLLGNLLPQSQYKMQYKFKNGTIVDAALFVQDKIIPIDAKFSLETYNKIQKENDKTKRDALMKQFKMDLKGRIDETSKYIRPEEKTTDFAFMFIPAEGIFYDLLVARVGSGISSSDLIEYAFSKRVIIVSPNSFFAYLQTVLQALKTLQVQESVQEIIENIRKLQKHLTTYDQNMQKLGKHIGTTVGAYNTSYKEFKKIDKDIVKVSGGENTIDPLLIDRPQEFDEET